MPLFRWRFGARSSGAPVDCTSQDGIDNNNPPPSYEESQHASLRAVLQGAMAVAPILWPSVRVDAPSLAQENSYRCLDAGEKDEEKQKTKRAILCPSAEEGAIIELLTNLAMAPCGDHPFLDRIREFSDFYFTPYIASAVDQSSSVQGGNSGNSSSIHQELGETVPIQEQQQKALKNLEVLRESSALVLCARVLEDYYAKLRNVDSAVDTNVAQEISTPYPSEKATSSSAEAAPPALTKTKTRLTQIISCLEEGCTCFDYDEARPKINHSTPSLCGCGHPRTSHAPSPLGISRLLRRYTNWDLTPYHELKHRSSSGSIKRRIHDIKVCGVPEGCACRDYDKGRRTGRCARCGHYHKDHLPIKAALESDKKHEKKEEKGKEKDGPNGTGVSDPKRGEWELSWILVENAYLLLSRITPVS